MMNTPNIITPNAHSKLFNMPDLLKKLTNVKINIVVDITIKMPRFTVKSVLVNIAYNVNAINIAINIIKNKYIVS